MSSEDQAKEFLWACELTKDKPAVVFSFKEEDEDEDYLVHTLFLKNGVLGASAVENERNIIQMETKNSNQKDLKTPIASLTLGRMDMCLLDLSFGEEVTFRLVEGSGPVFLSGQELIEYPENVGQDDDLDDYTETEEEDLKESEEESPKKEVSSKKRKALTAKGKGKAKKKKVETESESEEEESDEDEEMDSEGEEEEEEDEEEEEEVSSPEKKKSSRKDSSTKSGRKVVKKGKSVKKGKK